LNLANGDLVPIEERDSSEVLDTTVHGQQVAPKGAKARNPAFDITPNDLITGLVTEKGVVSAPFWQNLPRLIHG
jgi:methylthioribose-1-phosphate isomerase